MQATSSAPPSPLINKLAKPTGAYKLRAWLAMAGLALFMVLYFALTGWFALTAWRLTFGAGSGSKDAYWGWIIGACAAFLAVFMFKAVMFVKHGRTDDSLEITPEQQPELFRFLHRLADKAGAPRPHKVFVSPRVNAAVFYDLSILNLFLPSKKNLEIGLGLVNALTLGEFRAVLAHEFGHFAQRAMAVGRWVYIAQQIAAQLIARRDKLDDFLNGLARFDVRIAWVGWILQLIVWSIRSLVDSVFQLVLLMQRALSREMELNADLVAVSLTGSDALIHALYRLEAADDGWGRAVGFVMNEKAKGRLTRDVFEIQTQVVAHMGQLLGDPVYGKVPARVAPEPAQHRVFKAELAQPPQMWLSHPLNHEREANAKRHYIAAPIDARPAWALFDQPQVLREAMTAKLLGEAPAEAVPHEDPLAILSQQFGREFFNARYRGVYFGRSIARHATDVNELLADKQEASEAALDALYPESLSDDMERLRTLEKEKAQLNGLLKRTVHPPGGVILHRGKLLKRSALPLALLQVERDLAHVRERLQVHDKQCRSLHRAAAARLGEGWPEYLQGLLAALHFADHTEDNLRDLQGLLSNTVRVVTATRKVNKKGIARTVHDGNVLRDALAKVFDDARGVQLDETLLKRINAVSWTAALGELKLPGVAKETVGDWLNAVDSWVDHAANACAALRSNALEQLLISEAEVARHFRAGTSAGAAPAATRVPPGYETLRSGAERKRQTQLDWWGRFQTADGVLPASARLVVAGGIVAAVLGLGGTIGSASITVYNGLARPVVVKAGSAASLQVPPLSHATQSIAPDKLVKIETRSTDGQLIESFDADAHGSFGQFIYNVAGAAPLVEWTAAYGNASASPQRELGAPRWSSSSAGFLFVDAPKSISTKGGGGTREVLSGLGDMPPAQQLGMISDRAEALRLANVHARWDPITSPNIAQWLSVAANAPGFKPLLAARLAESPDEVLLRRLEQDTASDAERVGVCERDRARAAAAPQNPNLQYVVTRCLAEGPEKDQAFIDGHARHPDHGWYAYAASYIAATHAQWPRAIAAAEQAQQRVPALADEISLDLARMRRLTAQDTSAGMDQLSRHSEMLRRMLALENGQGITVPALKAYSELAHGRVESAVQLAHTQPKSESRLLRLAAASDRASASLVSQALALPLDQGLDDSTVWASVALAARAGRDLAGFDPMLRRAAPDHHEPMLRFVDALKHGQPPELAERLLDGLTPELRGHAYSIGSVLLGAQAPRAWREGAKRLLFASERPYFS